jgi:chromosome segregation ATPase
MQMKSIVKMVIAGCAIGMMTGCGVPQEEHDAIVAQLNTEHDQVVAQLNTKVAETDSLYKSEKDKTRTLSADLKDSSALNGELKDEIKELKTSLLTANSKVSSLESKLASTQATIKSASDKASKALSECSAMEMEAQAVQRRYDELIANLIRLNKIKPEDIGLDPSLAAGVDMDMGEEAVTEDSSANDLLKEMGVL